MTIKQDLRVVFSLVFFLQFSLVSKAEENRNQNFEFQKSWSSWTQFQNQFEGNLKFKDVENLIVSGVSSEDVLMVRQSLSLFREQSFPKLELQKVKKTGGEIPRILFPWAGKEITVELVLQQDLWAKVNGTAISRDEFDHWADLNGKLRGLDLFTQDGISVEKKLREESEIVPSHQEWMNLSPRERALVALNFRRLVESAMEVDLGSTSSASMKKTKSKFAFAFLTLLGSPIEAANDVKCIQGGFIGVRSKGEGSKNCDIQTAVKSLEKSLKSSCGANKSPCHPVLYGADQKNSGLLCIPTQELQTDAFACNKASPLRESPVSLDPQKSDPREYDLATADTKKFMESLVAAEKLKSSTNVPSDRLFSDPKLYDQVVKNQFQQMKQYVEQVEKEICLNSDSMKNETNRSQCYALTQRLLIFQRSQRLNRPAQLTGGMVSDSFKHQEYNHMTSDVKTTVLGHKLSTSPAEVSATPIECPIDPQSPSFDQSGKNVCQCLRGADLTPHANPKSDYKYACSPVTEIPTRQLARAVRGEKPKSEIKAQYILGPAILAVIATFVVSQQKDNKSKSKSGKKVNPLFLKNKPAPKPVFQKKTKAVD